MKTRKEEKAGRQEKKAESLLADFSKVSVQLTFEGEPKMLDMRKPLGNAIRAAAGDIALDEFARRVYFSEGPVEVPAEYIPFIMQVVRDKYNVPTQEAFESLLTI
ncbi:hypothetical protein [Bacteroides rodentium]